MALSLYNKYRPQTFKDVVGQHHVETTLANAVDKNTVSHAYLFCGPRGTGKTTTARILAKALLCERGPSSNPDSTCNQCKAISEGIHPDVYELDAASRTGVDNVREEIIGRVNFAPTQGAFKVYIIDEVHMLSTPAFNALLKTLEEPPEHVVFILCTTDVHKVPDTVQARCQRFDFKRIGSAEIVGRLQYICEREGFDAEPAALELIAQRSQGGMRDAIRSLEQASVFTSGKITYIAAETLLGMVDAEQLFVLCNNLALGDAAACFDWVASYVQSGSDIAILVNDLALHVRNLYAVRVSQGSDEHLASALEIDAESLPKLREQAEKFNSTERLSWMLSVLGALSAELKNAANARLALEVALTRILNPQGEQSIEALAARVAELEARLAGPVLTPQAQVPTVSTPEPQKAAPFAQSNVGVSATEYATVEAKPQGETPAVAPQTTASVAEPTAQSEASQATETVQELADNFDIYRQWNAVVDTIKKTKPGVAASLGGITPSLNSLNSKLTLEMPSDAATSKQYLETDANKKLMRDTVAKVFKTAYEIVFVLAPETKQTPAKTTATQAPVAQASREGGAANGGYEDACRNPNDEGADRQDYSVPAAETDSREAENIPSNSEPHPELSSEPSKEELDNILKNSFNGTISFED